MQPFDTASNIIKRMPKNSNKSLKSGKSKFSIMNKWATAFCLQFVCFLNYPRLVSTIQPYYLYTKYVNLGPVSTLVGTSKMKYHIVMFETILSFLQPLSEPHTTPKYNKVAIITPVRQMFNEFWILNHIIFTVAKDICFSFFGDCSEFNS